MKFIFIFEERLSFMWCPKRCPCFFLFFLFSREQKRAMMARAVWGTFLSSRPLFSSSPSSLSTFSLVSNSPFSSLSSTRIAPTSCFSSLCGGSTSSFQPTTSFLGTNEKWNWFQARLLTTEDESTEENVEEEEENLAKKGEREKWLRQFRKTRKWDKTMDEEPDNRMTEEEMEAIKSKYLDHEIWHHPLREPLLSRPQKPDHLVLFFFFSFFSSFFSFSFLLFFSFSLFSFSLFSSFFFLPIQKINLIFYFDKNSVFLIHSKNFDQMSTNQKTLSKEKERTNTFAQQKTSSNTKQFFKWEDIQM